MHHPIACPNPGTVASITYLVLLLVTSASIAGFYGWRRLHAPWRTVSFVVFMLCILLLVDSFTLGVADLLTVPLVQTPSCP